MVHSPVRGAKTLNSPLLPVIMPPTGLAALAA
jgi:hypothetical protein